MLDKVLVYYEEIVGYLCYIFGSYLNNECWHHNSYKHKKKDTWEKITNKEK